MSDRRVVIITGASRGLGAATAHWLGSAGTALTLVARTESMLAEVAAHITRLGGEALPVCADVRDPDACARVVARTLAHFHRLDALINNAGIVQPISPTLETEPEAFKQSIEVNLLGPFHLMRAAIAPLRASGGRIVNVLTGAALNPVPGWSAYCSSKAGLLLLTRVVAAEEPALTVIAFRPGVVDTDMQAAIRREGPGRMPSEQVEYFQRLKTDRQLEPPEVPGRSLAWLALDGPRELSGRMVDYDHPQIMLSARSRFGDRFERPGGAPAAG